MVSIWPFMDYEPATELGVEPEWHPGSGLLM